MKRIFSLILVSLILLTGFSVSADEDIFETFEEVEVSEIRINVNVANETVEVNGEPIDCVKPYLKNSVTMIPIDVIVNAFGAEINRDGELITIEYFDAEIIFRINSKDVIINGQTIAMPEIVEIYEGVEMAPLRFLAESFGADVVYDSESRDIVITGLNDGIGVEGDFKLLLKYGNKSKVGNSKEMWRFEKPSNFDMMENYWGGGYEFAIEDIYFQLTVTKNKTKMTLEQLYIAMQSSALPNNESLSYGVLIEKYVGTRSGLPYVSIVMRSTDTLRQSCAFLTDKFAYIFNVYIPIENYVNLKEKTTFDTVLDTFEVNYTGGDDDTIDIGTRKEVTAEKKEIYKDGNYSWEIKPIEDWKVGEYYGFFNKVNITRESKIELPEKEEEEDYYYGYYGTSLSMLLGGYSYDSQNTISNASLIVSVYSNPDGQSISDWVMSKYIPEKENINPEYLTITEISDTKIGEYDAKTFSKETKYNDYTWCQKFYYMYYVGYRYILNLSYDKRDGEEEGFLTNAYEMINSFVPGDINYDDLGEALERDNYTVTDQILKTYENKYLKFTLPYLWTAYGYSGGAQVTVYGSSSGGYSSSSNSLMIERYFLDKVDENGEIYMRSLEEVAKKELIDARNSNIRNMIMIKPFEKTTYKNRDAYTFIVGNKDDEGKVTQTSEVFFVAGNDNDYFLVANIITDMYKGTRNEKINKAILDSLEFK